MVIYDYTTSAGKNLIKTYIDKLPKKEQLEIYEIRNEIRERGIEAFEKINTRQLRGKLWEIKVSQTRMMYVVINKEGVAFLHICIKQKGKAEIKELSTAIKRAEKEKII